MADFRLKSENQKFREIFYWDCSASKINSKNINHVLFWNIKWFSKLLIKKVVGVFDSRKS